MEGSSVEGEGVSPPAATGGCLSVSLIFFLLNDNVNVAQSLWLALTIIFLMHCTRQLSIIKPPISS